MKTATIIAFVGVVLMFACVALTGCPLHDPVPVDPDYPPFSVTVTRDASRDR